MIEPKFVAVLYGWTYDTLKKQTDGLTHEDSLLQLPFRANCLNWVLGHILWSRNRILPLLGEAPIWSAEVAARYANGSDPVTPEHMIGVVRFEQMLADLDTLQQRTLAGLERMTAADFERPSDVEAYTLGQRLLTLLRHEAYHTGQTEQLRELAGKNDKVL